MVGQTWLFFGATASYTSDDVAPFGGNDTAPDTVRITETSYALLLGVRPVVVSGLVDVSLWVAGRAGRQVFGGDEIDPTVQIPIRPGTRSTTLGGLFGMAVERELVDALALRISAQIGSVSYSSLDEVRVRDDEKRTTEQSLWSARLSLSPGFDLRLYF